MTRKNKEGGVQNRLKIMTILGTRPEIIRLSRVMARLDDTCEHVLVHTGQNYDFELNEVFFKDLGVREPSYYLAVDTSSLGATVGEILSKTERTLLEVRPDAVLILGDTNSALAAYICRRHKIPVYHMEAGNRCFDRNVPEETNRKLVDHISDFNLVYTEHARRNLLAEGLPARRIYLTGSPMREVLDFNIRAIEQSNVVRELGLKENGYFMVSLHREENVDNKMVLDELVNTLNILAVEFDVPVVVSTHPRTRARLEAGRINIDSGKIHWMKPFGFNDYNQLQKSSLCVISDSGTIAEESVMLGFSAVTPRFSIERPEAMDTGAIMACGTGSDNIARCVRTVIESKTEEGTADASSFHPREYMITNTSSRVVNLILSTAKLSNAWDGIR